MGDDPSRREVICSGCALLAAGCQPSSPPAQVVDTDDTANPWTGSIGDTDVGTDPYPCEQDISPGGAGWTELPLSQYPELENVDGWVTVNAGGREVIVAHVEQDCYVAILRACAQREPRHPRRVWGTAAARAQDLALPIRSATPPHSSLAPPSPAPQLRRCAWSPRPSAAATAALPDADVGTGDGHGNDYEVEMLVFLGAHLRVSDLRASRPR